MAPTRNTNPKVLRADLVKNLKVAVAEKGVALTDDLNAKIATQALLKHPRTVSEAPDGFWNHSNSTVLRSLAGLMAEGIELEGRTAELWQSAVASGNVTVIDGDESGAFDEDGFRDGDIVLGSYVVRKSADAQGVHVFRKGGERSGNSIQDMADGLIDE